MLDVCIGGIFTNIFRKDTCLYERKQKLVIVYLKENGRVFINICKKAEAKNIHLSESRNHLQEIGNYLLLSERKQKIYKGNFNFGKNLAYGKHQDKNPTACLVQ